MKNQLNLNQLNQCAQSATKNEDFADLKESHKQFVDYFLQHPASQTAAYLKVYPDIKRNTAERNASKLMEHPRVKKYLEYRKKEIQDALLQREVFTREGILKELQELADLAKKEGKYSPAIRAQELIGKELGLFSDRVKIGGDEENPASIKVEEVNNIDLSLLSVDELKALRRLQLKALKKENF